MNREKIINLYGKRAVIDNNIIGDLCELGCLGWLNQLFSEVMIPESILNDEAQRYKRELDKIAFTSTTIQNAETYEFLEDILDKHGGLSDYDAELVAIAYEKYVLCTSNEKRIMTTCNENGIEYTGTLGILCLAYEKNLITLDGLDDYINRLNDECSCFLSNRIISSVKNTYGLCTVAL